MLLLFSACHKDITLCLRIYLIFYEFYSTGLFVSVLDELTKTNSVKSCKFKTQFVEQRSFPVTFIWTCSTYKSRDNLLSDLWIYLNLQVPIVCDT